MWTLICSVFQQVSVWITVARVKSVTVIPKLSTGCDTQWDDTIDTLLSSTVLINKDFGGSL
jgi:hypothetical protein